MNKKKYIKYIEVEKDAPIYAHRIANEMNIKGLNQKEFASLCGVSASNISTWLKGTFVPNVNDFNTMACKLGVTTDYLLGNTNVKAKSQNLKDVCEYTGLSEKAVQILKKFNNSNNSTWRMDIINDFIENDNFDYLIVVLTEYATHKNSNINYSFYNINTDEIAISKVQNLLFEMMKCIKEKNKLKCKNDYRSYYIILNNAYNKGLLTDKQYKDVLKEYQKGNYNYEPENYISLKQKESEQNG